ncbi:ribosome maturation factor RimP [Frankia nepalensis]|uniref:ribosome maturation factor RimP n=1 Tax=Frankia nepalensis TaxID=1836974 RepID=UPI0027DE3817|nr:ribosome maturation factor RimP [Frankia nepalensis]
MTETGVSGGSARSNREAGSAAAPRAAVAERLAPALAEAGFDLEDLSLSRAGSRSVLRVAVDRDGGVDLDAVADASRLISDLLDRVGDEVGLTGAYVLEVTSPGVDRPLTEPRHWRRARGRLVEARRADGAVALGRVLGADDEGVDLAVPTGPARRGRPARTRIERLRFADVARAVVQVEFGHDAEAEGVDSADAEAEAADVEAAEELLDGDVVLELAGDPDDAEPAGTAFDDDGAGDGVDDGPDESDTGDDQPDGTARSLQARDGAGREDVGETPGEETDR